MKIRLESVRLSFPNLFTAKEFKAGDGKPRFDATFLIEPGSKNDKRIRDAIQQAGTEKLGAKWPKFLASVEGQSNKFCYLDGDTKDYEGYEGMMYLAAHSKIRPTVVDRDRSPLTEADGKVYGGCFVNAIVEIWVQTNENPGVRCGFSGVQFEKHGEAFGAGAPAAPEDFDDLGAGADAEEMV